MSRYNFLRSQSLLLTAGAIAFAIYTFGVPNNPPGFFTDESAISYNAWTISQSGRDEYGTPWPLYFRSFGEYKNPIYIYLLAALYYLFGPSILIARLLSCALGFMAAVLLGLLATRISHQSAIGIIVALSALLTPWLIESTRPVFEVAIYPLAIVLFLLVLWYAQSKEKWSLLNVTLLAATLALLTYSYTTGRLFTPLLALGLVFFANRKRIASIIHTWIAYGVTLIPLLVFNLRNPGALTERFHQVTYITPEMPLVEILIRFIKHMLHNVSLIKLLLTGSGYVHMGSMLVATAILTGMGIFLILRHHWREPWWRFILYGLVMSVVPASFVDDYHSLLRLIPFPTFFIILGVPAIMWLREAGVNQSIRRNALVCLVILILAQGAIFLWQYHRVGPSYAEARDGNYPKIFAVAVSIPRRPIYLVGGESINDYGRYVHAYWYGVLRGMDASQFVHLPPGETPSVGALVISTEKNCSRCQVIMQTASSAPSPYTVYIAN